MKKVMVILVSMAILCGVTSVVLAGEEEGAFSGTVELGASMKYVDKLSGTLIHDDPTAWLYAELDHESGFYVAVEDYKKLDKSDYDDPSLYIGFGKDLVIWNWDIGYAYYSEYQMHAVYANIDFPKPGSFNLTPFLNVEAEFSDNSEAGDGGVLYRFGVKTAIEIFEQSVFLEASIAGHDGAWDTRPELVSSASITASTYISLIEEVVDLAPEMSYQKRIGHKPEDGGMTDDEFFAGAKLVFYF